MTPPAIFTVSPLAVDVPADADYRPFADAEQQHLWVFAKSERYDVVDRNGVILGRAVEWMAWPNAETVSLLRPGQPANEATVPPMTSWVGVRWTAGAGRILGGDIVGVRLQDDGRMVAVERG